MEILSTLFSALIWILAIPFLIWCFYMGVTRNARMAKKARKWRDEQVRQQLDREIRDMEVRRKHAEKRLREQEEEEGEAA